MAGESLYYSNSSFAFRIDEEGRIIDNMTNQSIGICNQKKKEILRDYDFLSEENIALKAKLDEIEKLLEANKNSLPDALKKLIEKPPSVESLQSEVADLKNMLAAFLTNQGGNRNVTVDGNLPKSETKPGGNKGSGKNLPTVGDKSEQSE